jgi:hypothetical protein
VELTALLLLPLVGGYLFASNCNATRFRAAREEGHRLYFRAAFYAVFLFFFAALLRILLVKYCASYRDLEHVSLSAIQPILKEGKEESALIVLLAFAAMLIGWLGARLLNIILREGPWLLAAIKEDEFEALLHRSLARAMPIAMTMENGKVYVGFVRKTFKPMMARKNFRILPLMSGYRNDKGKVTFTTFYDEAFEKVGLKEGGGSHLLVEDFEMVFPTDKVHSAGLFDVRTYNEFQKLAPPGPNSEEIESDRRP